MSLSPGARLGPYEIVAPIGAGGMGEVYRARDTRLGRDVALKVLATHVSADADRMRRFEQEARAAAALNHPNIVALFDVGTHESAPYLVSELLDGQTLRDALNAGSLTPRRAVEYAVQIARGLAAAHERGIVHRDLKPENIFITTDGRAKILDFGLAKLTSADAPDSATMVPTTPPATNPGVVLGTVGYMAPEQVRGLPADHRADLFAFGAVLYEMLTGQRAFARDTPAETMTAILKDEPPLVHDGSERLSPGLQRVITHCLEKQPSLRFKSADDLAFALETLSSSTITPAGGTPVQAERRSRRSVVPVAVAALLGAAIAALAMFWTRPVPAAAPFFRFVVTPPPGWRLTSLSNTVSPVAMAPDGHALVATGVNAQGRTTLWIRILAQEESRVLTGTEGVGVFFWSQDSRSVAFVANSKLTGIDVASGATTPIADVPFVYAGAWGRTDQILVATADGLKRIRGTGGTLVKETSLAPDEALHTTPWFFPDGVHYAFTTILGKEIRAGASRALDIGTLDSTARTRLFDAKQFGPLLALADGRLTYTRGNRVVAQPFDLQTLTLNGEPETILDRVQLIENRPYPLIAATGAGPLAYVPEQANPLHRLAWFDRAGRRLSQVGDVADQSNLELSPDDKRLALAILEPGKKTRDIWMFDLDRDIKTRFTFEAGEERTAVWWPDSSRVAFNSQRTSTERDLFEKPANGAGTERVLIANGFSKDPLGISPDGRLLLYRESARTGNDIWIKALDGVAKPYAIAATPADENYGKFSPDGRWIAFASDETGAREIFVVPVSGTGGKWQVSTAGGTMPRWRGDGRELYYVGTDGTLMATVVDGSSAGFQIGTTSALFNIPLANQLGYQYVVTRDGQRFLANVDDAAASFPLVVLSDWRALLKK